MCNILCRSCTCSVKYGYSINSTSEYRNTVDFHSQRLAIIEFSRQEFGKPRPGKTHKTMFYNILAPTISVKYLKNKRKVQFSSSKRYLATESVLFYILCKMPTNIFRRKRDILFFSLYSITRSFDHFDRSYQAAGIPVSPSL